ncbi:MAG: arsenate reductase (glutaredoxin) [Alphaproteobacteria bacterium]|nr:arsenate reductase (glutaredoxin) [Alphaproteobacteria bacterium]
MQEASVDIYHNPRCSKSRATLDLLRERGIDASVIEYLKEPPDEIELRQLLDLLGISARELLRTGEAPYKQLGLQDQSLSEDKIIEAILKFPILMERPIVVTNGKARIGRPPEAVLEIL